jgi:hypothetical protein
MLSGMRPPILGSAGVTPERRRDERRGGAGAEEAKAYCFRCSD